MTIQDGVPVRHNCHDDVWSVFFKKNKKGQLICAKCKTVISGLEAYDSEPLDEWSAAKVSKRREGEDDIRWLRTRLSKVLKDILDDTKRR